MLIGRKVKTKRELAKLSQTELGEMIGVCQGTISNIENTGRTEFDVLLKICDALKCDIKDFLPENLQVVNAETITNSQIQSPIETINNNVDVEKIINPLHEAIKELLQQNTIKDATIQSFIERDIKKDAIIQALLEQLASK